MDEVVDHDRESVRDHDIGDRDRVTGADRAHDQNDRDRKNADENPRRAGEAPQEDDIARLRDREDQDHDDPDHDRKIDLRRDRLLGEEADHVRGARDQSPNQSRGARDRSPNLDRPSRNIRRSRRIKTRNVVARINRIAMGRKMMGIRRKGREARRIEAKKRAGIRDRTKNRNLKKNLVAVLITVTARTKLNLRIRKIIYANEFEEFAITFVLLIKRFSCDDFATCIDVMTQ